MLYDAKHHPPHTHSLCYGAIHHTTRATPEHFGHLPCSILINRETPHISTPAHHARDMTTATASSAAAVTIPSGSPDEQLRTLKELKNAVIGNTWKKVEYASDDELLH